MTDYKTILLQLCASLTQVDHMGAAWEQVGTALNMAGIDTNGGGAIEIANKLSELGISTFDGTILNTSNEPYYQ